MSALGKDMTPEEYARLRELYDPVADLPPEERSEVLRKTCAGEPEILAKLQAMFSLHETNSFEPPDAESLAHALDATLSDLSGQEIGRYRLEARLGKGGTGTVYRARNLDSSDLCAIKVLDPSVANSGEAVRRFQREIAIAERLEHPHLVPILDHGCDGQLHWFAMQFIEGLTLEDALCAQEQGGARVPCDLMDPRVCAEIAMKLASALQCAHDQGIIHRDVSSRNVLIDGRGEPWLCDFGLAKAEDVASITSDRSFRGTPRYMSPEQAQGSAELDARTDVYSLGGVLLRMLAHEAPATGESIPEIIGEICSKKRRGLKRKIQRCPAPLGGVIRRAMFRSPWRRFESAQALSRDLNRYANGEPVLAPIPRPSLAGFVALRKYWAISAASILLFATAGVVHFRRSARTSDQQYQDSSVRQLDWMRREKEKLMEHLPDEPIFHDE